MKKQKKLIKKLFVLVGVLILVLLVLLGIEFNFFDSFSNFFKGSEKIVIEDNCGVVVGNLIHEIKSEENCRIRCINECELLSKDFLSVEFRMPEGFCYECD